MTEPNDVQSSLDRMKIHMELRGLQPNTVSTFARCARRFLAHTDKTPADVTSTDVESFLLDLVRKGRSPRTRNAAVCADIPRKYARKSGMPNIIEVLAGLVSYDG